MNNTNAGEATVTIIKQEGDVCIMVRKWKKTFTISKKTIRFKVCTVERIHVNTEAEVLGRMELVKFSFFTTEDEELVEIQNSHITGKRGLHGILINVFGFGDDNHELSQQHSGSLGEDNHITVPHVVEKQRHWKMATFNK